MHRRKLLAGALGVFGTAAAMSGTARASGGGSAGLEGPGEHLARALGASTRQIGHETGPDWLRVTFAVHGGGATVPFVVDVLADTSLVPRGVAYLLPGGGLNFTANFFTPRVRNLAHHLRTRGFLVVGVTPREDGATGADITDGWGLAAHRADLQHTVRAFDALVRLPYQYIGHSAGAALALDTAARDRCPRLRRVVVLDTTGPYAGELRLQAARTQAVLQAQLDSGVYAADTGIKGLVARAVADPETSSPVPRPVDPSTRFTNAGLAHFALVNTRLLPGVTNWIYTRGHSAGTFTFGATPVDDRFSLTHTPLATWHAATSTLGSGLAPTALLRDLAAVWAGDEATYRIPWHDIRAEVTWVNMALGRGDEPRGVELIRDGGNGDVNFHVIPGYGHADPVWGDHAERDVWSLLDKFQS